MSVEIVCGKYNIITDPWCTGPAFVNGWWLENKPPRDWRKRIAFSNLIYISHTHPDHLNTHTLKEVKRINDKTQIVIPKFNNTKCFDLLKGIGF